MAVDIAQWFCLATCESLAHVVIIFVAFVARRSVSEGSDHRPVVGTSFISGTVGDRRRDEKAAIVARTGVPSKAKKSGLQRVCASRHYAL